MVRSPRREAFGVDVYFVLSPVPRMTGKDGSSLNEECNGRHRQEGDTCERLRKWIYQTFGEKVRVSFEYHSVESTSLMNK